jgi:hypothetical protein
MDAYIQDIAASDCATMISAQDFQKFCDAAGIQNVLPETSIRRSIALAQFSAASAVALRVPVQQPHAQRTFG